MSTFAKFITRHVAVCPDGTYGTANAGDAGVDGGVCGTCCTIIHSSVATVGTGCNGGAHDDSSTVVAGVAGDILGTVGAGCTSGAVDAGCAGGAGGASGSGCVDGVCEVKSIRRSFANDRD